MEGPLRNGVVDSVTMKQLLGFFEHSGYADVQHKQAMFEHVHKVTCMGQLQPYDVMYACQVATMMDVWDESQWRHVS